MFFKDHEKRVYKPAWAEGTGGYDPVQLENLLVYHSGGAFYEWMSDRNAATVAPGDVNEGDVSPEGKRVKLASAAAAELSLARVARASFGFDETILDGEVLERLYEFLGYMEGKDESAGKPPESPESSPDSSSPPAPTTNT